MAKAKSKKALGWYTVRVLLKITIRGSRKNFVEYEDRYVLIRAQDANAAKKTAERVLRRENSRYKNSDGHWVTWNFFRVVDTLELLDDKLEDGTEVWYRFLVTRDPMKLIKKERLVP